MTNTPDPHATPGEGTSHGEGTPQPVAWAVVLADGQRIYDVYGIEEEAKAIDEAVTGNHGVVPLYRKPQPTLTDEERTFLRMVRDTYAMQDDDEVCGMIAASISGLLERTK